MNPSLLKELECPACHDWFSTAHGRNMHLSQASGCRWYRKGKLRDFGPTAGNSANNTRTIETNKKDEDAHALEALINDLPEDPLLPKEIMEQMMEEDQVFFVPEELNGPARAGPSSERAHKPFRTLECSLNHNDDEAPFIEEDRHAGYKLKMSQTLHTQWEEHLSKHDEGSATPPAKVRDRDYAPFASELDWRIAQWAVRDGPGRSSLDKLLALPKVCLLLIL